MKKLFFYFTCIFCIILFSNCTQNIPSDIKSAYDELPENVDFNYHVKPILSDKCFACHGPDMNNQKAGLRLDIAENAYDPKSLEKSEVINRIFSKDPETLMPPPEFNVTLTKKEIATITKWIEQGAEYKPHWSFIKPQKSVFLLQVN